MKFAYSAYTPQHKNSQFPLYIVDGGFIISMNTRDTAYLKDIIPKDFDDFYDYLEATFHQIKSMDEFCPHCGAEIK